MFHYTSDNVSANIAHCIFLIGSKCWNNDITSGKTFNSFKFFLGDGFKNFLHHMLVKQWVLIKQHLQQIGFPTIYTLLTTPKSVIPAPQLLRAISCILYQQVQLSFHFTQEKMTLWYKGLVGILC